MRLTWIKLEGYKAPTYRAETGIGDFYVTRQANEAGRVVGYSATLNHSETNPAGWNWTNFRAKASLVEAKAFCAGFHGFALSGVVSK